MSFYGELFGWQFDVGSEDIGRYTMCLLEGRPVAAIMPNVDENARDFWWQVYFATDDCDATAKRIVAAGGTIIAEPKDVLDNGRMAVAKDPVGAPFALWQLPPKDKAWRSRRWPRRLRATYTRTPGVMHMLAAPACWSRAA